MKVTHLVFNPASMQWSLVTHFEDGSKLHINITPDAVEELKRRKAIVIDMFKHGTGDYDKHMIYWPI